MCYMYTNLYGAVRCYSSRKPSTTEPVKCMCLIRKRASTFRLCIINNWQFSRHTKSSSTSSSSFSNCCRRRRRCCRRLSASKWVHFPCGAVAIIVVAYFKCVICFVFFPARLACVRVCLFIFDNSYGIIYLYIVCCIFDRIHVCRWCVYAFYFNSVSFSILYLIRLAFGFTKLLLFTL